MGCRHAKKVGLVPDSGWGSRLQFLFNKIHINLPFILRRNFATTGAEEFIFYQFIRRPADVDFTRRDGRQHFVRKDPGTTFP